MSAFQSPRINESFDSSADVSKVVVLDVGHGNCTVVTDGAAAVVVDTGSGAVLMEYLLSASIFHIESVILSHSDFDHIGGLVQLFASGLFAIDEICLNSDALKRSKAWENLRFEIQDLEESGKLRVRGSLCRGESVKSSVAGVSIDVLSPRRAMAMSGPGSRTRSGSQITPNTMSIVLMISFNSEPLALLPGDMDSVAFEDLLGTGQNLRADYLILPHHGGRWGATNQLGALVERLCELVSPKEVLVSNGRGKFDNPRPEVIAAVKQAAPNSHVSCTQLSEICYASRPPDNPGLDLTVHSAGREAGKCCAGSVVIDLAVPNGRGRDHSMHNAFIDQFSATALCRRFSSP